MWGRIEFPFGGGEVQARLEDDGEWTVSGGHLEEATRAVLAAVLGHRFPLDDNPAWGSPGGAALVAAAKAHQGRVLEVRAAAPIPEDATP